MHTLKNFEMGSSFRVKEMIKLQHHNMKHRMSQRDEKAKLLEQNVFITVANNAVMNVDYERFL